MVLSFANLGSALRGAAASFKTRPATFRLTHWESLVDSIRSATGRLQSLGDEELKRQALELRLRSLHGDGAHVDELLVQAFALVAESFRRTTGFEYFDVQLVAGIALARGCVAEMQTGEGKTFVAALPAFVHGISGRGAHVATTNPYLAARDAEQVGPILERLGLSVGLLPEPHDEERSVRAYRCDVTYGTGYQFGFDYLRDQLTLRRHPPLSLGSAVRGSLRGGLPKPKLLQRELGFAIVDEIDSVLIDEASTPLILSEFASSVESMDNYLIARRTVAGYRRGVHFMLDRRSGQIQLTKDGELRAFETLQDIPSRQLDRPWLQYIRNGLRADHLLERDVDYVVREGAIQIVDRYTGRICPERKWSDGLHQAIEVKESVALTPPNNSSARITRQKYFRLYQRLCGMTGTATGSEREFREVYRLSVAAIPLHRPSRRRNVSARYFAHAAAKLEALSQDVRQRQRTGQPVLIGTRSIRDSRAVANRLKQDRIEFVLLNGVQDEHEASIVSRAGQAGVVTIATNMAGRGTDIRLSAEATSAGGLHVIATNHHESERVERQLIGRCARQGDPGSYQMLADAADELFEKHAPELSETIRQAAGPDGSCERDFSAEVARLQARLLRESYEKRLRLMEHDRWTESLLETFLSEA